MKKSELALKSIAELRTMAKGAGIRAARDWKKDDFISALSQVRSSKPATKKNKARKTAAPQKKAEARARKKAALPKKKKPSPEALEGLTVAELRSLAKECGITLKRSYKKAEIVKAIEKAKCAPLPKKKAPQPSSPLLSAPGKDKVVSMAVSPGKIYTYWEMTELTCESYKGSLNLKVIDQEDGSFYYMPISERVGDHDLHVSPGSTYTIELGSIDRRGQFTTFVESKVLKMPFAGMAKETSHPYKKSLPEEFFIIHFPVSSY